MPEGLPSQTETFPAAAASSADSATLRSAANDQIAASGSVAKVAYPPPVLRIGDLDERGNTVKYIYSIDPNYVVYYSRLERWVTRANDTDAHETHRPALSAPIKSLVRFSGPAYEREGVQVQLSFDPQIRNDQLRKLLPLGTARAKLRALLNGWPRRESYDSSIATALQGHGLAWLRGGLASAGRFDGVVHRRGGRGVSGRAVAAACSFSKAPVMPEVMLEPSVLASADCSSCDMLWSPFALMRIRLPGEAVGKN
jgi:hypothetical protein